MALIRLKFNSLSLQRAVDVNVIMPSEPKFDWKNPKSMEMLYSQQLKPMKVLYLLHGFCGDQDDWLRFSGVETYAAGKNLAIVMPAGYNGAYINHEGTNKFSDFIALEIPMMLRRLFPFLSEKREDTYIGGLSMGAVGALRFCLKYPEKYSHGILMSLGLPEGQVDTKDENDVYYMIEKRQKENISLPKFWVCCGTGDVMPGEHGRLYMGYSGAICLYHYILDHGYKAEFYEAEGAHEWPFWNWAIKTALNEWLPL